MKQYETNLRHRAYYFSIDVVKFTKKIRIDKKYFSFISQLIRSSAPIGANLIKNTKSVSKKDFSRYLAISPRSANETKYWLCLFRDGLEIKIEKKDTLLKKCEELSEMVAASIKKIQNKT